MSKSKCQNKSKYQISNVKTNFIILFFVILILNSFCILNFGTCHYTYAQDSSQEDEALFVAKKAYDDGFYDVSLGLLERFLKNYPDSKKFSEANLLIGQCYFHQNKFVESLNKFEDLKGRPEAITLQDAVCYWIAEVNFKGNNFSKAAEYYQKVIAGFPKSVYLGPSYYSLGWCFFQEHYFDKALEVFKLVEEKYPKDSFSEDASLKIIECLYNLKDYSGIKNKMKAYLKAYSKDPAKAAYLYFYLGESEYYLNNFNEAAQSYSRSVLNAIDEKMKSSGRLGAGWAYLKLKQYQEAEDNFSKVDFSSLEKSSQDTLLLGKAVLKQETKMFSEAKNLYQELIKSTVDSLTLMQAYLGQADVLYNMSDYKQAEKIYQEALSKISENVPMDTADKLHYGLAWVFLKQGEFKEAIDEFNKIAKQSEDKVVKVSALCQIGDTYQDSGDFKKAIETYDTILKDYSDSFYADYVQYQLGLTLLKDANYDGAVMAFKALKANFADSKLLDKATYALGLTYFQRQDYKSSEEIFAKFQDDFKDSSLKSQVIYLWGSSLYNLGRFSDAVDAFKDAIRVAGDDKELVQKCEYEIADCFYKLGNEKEAMARFNALRSKYPDSKLAPEVMWWLGEYYYQHNQPEVARRYFSSLIQDFSKSNLVPDAYYALGASFVAESRFDEAINNFKKVLEFGKSDLAGTATIAIVDIYKKQEKFDLALKACQQALNDYKNLDHLIYPEMGEVYYRMADYETAVDYYRKSLDLVPVRQMSDIQFKIAEIRQAQGKNDAAVEEYLKVTYLYSENNVLAVKSLLRVASIYEDKENYPEAMKIYQRLAAMDTEEAKYAQERMEWIRGHKK